MNLNKKIDWRQINWFQVGVLVVAVWSCWLTYVATWEMSDLRQNHLVLLAESMLRGKLSLPEDNNLTYDVVKTDRGDYLYFGPMASVVLMPFVAVMGDQTPQAIIGVMSLALIMWSVYLISKEFGFKGEDRWWLAMFMGFSTVLLGVAMINYSAWQTQALGAAWVFIALAEYYTRRRYWLIGVLVGLAGLSRITLYLSLIYFGLNLMRKPDWRKNAVKLAVPVVVSVMLLLSYNYLRFGSWFEAGYGLNLTNQSKLHFAINQSLGTFSLYHLPANLYYLLINPPQPIWFPGGRVMLPPFFKADPWGMAIWFTSPLLLFLFRGKGGKDSMNLWVSVLVLAAPVLTYFGIGWIQFGYRYSLDFLPFLVVLLLPNLKPKLTKMMKILITWGILFDSFYLVSMFGMYPMWEFIWGVLGRGH